MEIAGAHRLSLNYESKCNDILPFNPTAENMAKWIVDTVPHCYKATVQENENNIATYVEAGSTNSVSEDIER